MKDDKYDVTFQFETPQGLITIDCNDEDVDFWEQVFSGKMPIEIIDMNDCEEAVFH